MRNTSIAKFVFLLLLAAAFLSFVVGAYFLARGVSARAQPGAFEAAFATTVRDLAIRGRTRGLVNPVATTPETVAEGRAHFADHCASCHGNDGSGNTEMGRGLYPRAPDMRLPATQNLSDAELFYIIENGVRLTGMPGWGTGTKEGETQSWHLVQFIRHLPALTPAEIEEMKSLNPRSPADVRQEIEEEKFLQGGDDAPQ